MDGDMGEMIKFTGTRGQPGEGDIINSQSAIDRSKTKDS